MATSPFPSTRVHYAKGVKGKLKAVVSTVGPLAVLAVNLIDDGELSGADWSEIVGAALAVVLVYLVPNKTEPVQVKDAPETPGL